MNKQEREMRCQLHASNVNWVRSARLNDNFSPAQMDTTEYPPEGQNVECDTWPRSLMKGNTMKHLLYFAIKRRVMRICCLFGKHDHKMGVWAKGGGAFGCMWCHKPLSNEQMLREADRQIRRMFRGKT